MKAWSCASFGRADDGVGAGAEQAAMNNNVVIISASEMVSTRFIITLLKEGTSHRNLSSGSSALDLPLLIDTVSIKSNSRSWPDVTPKTTSTLYLPLNMSQKRSHI